MNSPQVFIYFKYLFIYVIGLFSIVLSFVVFSSRCTARVHLVSAIKGPQLRDLFKGMVHEVVFCMFFFVTTNNGVILFRFFFLS